MVAFDWFIFRSLNLEEFLSHFEENQDQAKNWYIWWSNYYNEFAWRFYEEQYIRHKLLEFREFSRAHSLRLSYPEELGDSNNPEYYYRAWKHWQDEAELLQIHCEVAKQLCQQYSSLVPTGAFMIGEFFWQKQKQKIEQGWTEQSIKSAKALWFNSNITQPPSNHLAQLKSLPYHEYLKTSHWRKVKAALMLIEYASCEDCNIFSDFFYGGDWETEIHVHHLHYRNRGCERYEDICLLCREHHKEAHSS